MNHLCDLRVLNLARNLLSHVDNLNGLDSLTELNLRHNQITFVVSTRWTPDEFCFSAKGVMRMLGILGVEVSPLSEAAAAHSCRVLIPLS